MMQNLIATETTAAPLAASTTTKGVDDIYVTHMIIQLNKICAAA